MNVLESMCSLRLASVLLTLFLVAIPESGGSEATASLRRRMAFANIAAINGNLVMIEGTFGPTDFFENLRSADSKDRTIFLNDAGEVQCFPDRMTITLFIMGPIPKEREKALPTSFDADYMEELRFRADWKRGLSGDTDCSSRMGSSLIRRFSVPSAFTGAGRR